jgi:hypothetical protein
LPVDAEHRLWLQKTATLLHSLQLPFLSMLSEG